MTATLKKFWKNGIFQTAITIALIGGITVGFWYGSQAALNTNNPVLAVISGSMCIPNDGACDGWVSLNHPFERTLHKGDLIIIQGVNPSGLNADYPNSDIIVFVSPRDPDELIVHRIVSAQEVEGVLYFITKGDGNGNKWPSTPEFGIDEWNGYPYGIPQTLVVGKVIMRIPWIGHVVLFMRGTYGVPLVIIIILLLVIVELFIPYLRSKKKPKVSEAYTGGTVMLSAG